MKYKMGDNRCTSRNHRETGKDFGPHTVNHPFGDKLEQGKEYGCCEYQRTAQRHIDTRGDIPARKDNAQATIGENNGGDARFGDFTTKEESPKNHNECGIGKKD